jgi:SAM-dependent methyltransferase
VHRHVLHTLPTPEPAFRTKFSYALAHFNAFRAHSQVEPRDARFYEFGAGWDLIVPLSYAALGVDSQLIVDIASIARLELVDETIRRLSTLRAELEREAERPLRELGPASVSTLSELRARFGIDYVAPRDARATGLPSASFDFVSNTNTLEHVPAEDLVPLLAECRRLLRPEGVLSCRIDLRDHASYADARVSAYDFLRFSPRTWRVINAPLAYQNRLRRPDYLRTFAESGLEIVAERAFRPKAESLEPLRALRLAEPFSTGYSFDDLAVQSLTVVAKPANRT